VPPPCVRFEVFTAVTIKNAVFSLRSQDLNQLAASQLELPRKRSGTGQIEIIKKYWESTSGLKQAKGFTPEPSARRTKDLLKLNRDQLR
jgi:hypothetical protein